MKSAAVVILSLAAVLPAHADFSYTSTRKSSQATPAAGPQVSKHYLKGQKMKVDNGDTSTIIDFDAQTLTTVNNRDKTYTVTKFGDLTQAMDKMQVETQVDVKETGQHKTINGFDATEMIMTVSVEAGPAGRPGMPQGMKMNMEMDTWSSTAVPGAQELKAFYQKNAGRFPWAAMGGGGSAGTQKAMSDMQKKMATSGGVPLLQTVRMKSVGNEAQTQQAQAGMAQARARLEEMKKQGGQQAAMAEQMLARLGAAGMPGAGGSGALFEITMESSDFSTGSIPDSAFAIPAGYQMKQQK